MSALLPSDDAVEAFMQCSAKMQREQNYSADHPVLIRAALIAAWNRRTAPVEEPSAWEAVDEKGNDNFATSIYEEGHKGLLVARCNQNGQYPWQAASIIRGLKANKTLPAPTAPSREDVARAVEALRPFAEALKRVDRGGPDNACFIGSQLTLGDLRDAEAAILSLLGQTGDGWLPIESAPKDGTPILVAEGEAVSVETWSDEWLSFGHVDGEGEFTRSFATHYRPLPAPPAKEGR
jgi:hypothetical protein